MIEPHDDLRELLARACAEVRALRRSRHEALRCALIERDNERRELCAFLSDNASESGRFVRREFVPSYRRIVGASSLFRWLEVLGRGKLPDDLRLRSGASVDAIENVWRKIQDGIQRDKRPDSPFRARHAELIARVTHLVRSEQVARYSRVIAAAEETAAREFERARELHARQLQSCEARVERAQDVLRFCMPQPGINVMPDSPCMERDRLRVASLRVRLDRHVAATLLHSRTDGSIRMAEPEGRVRRLLRTFARDRIRFRHGGDYDNVFKGLFGEWMAYCWARQRGHETVAQFLQYRDRGTDTGTDLMIGRVAVEVRLQTWWPGDPYMSELDHRAKSRHSERVLWARRADVGEWELFGWNYLREAIESGNACHFPSQNPLTEW